MKYRKSEAKNFARQHMKGIWAASLTPFTPDYKIDEEGIKHNIRHCIDDLQIDGMFLNGLMGEAFSQTIEERKRIFKLVVEEAMGKMIIMPYTSDSCLENTLDMTRYAEDIGADLAIIINPKFYFNAMTEEGVFQYYEYIANGVNIGIVLFNQMEHGYLMSPSLISRLAEIENIVGVKDIAPSTEIMRARILCGDRILVSDVNEDNWLTNLTIKGQAGYIATALPFLLQSKKLKLIREYTNLAIDGDIEKAWEASKRLEDIRRALLSVTFPGKVQASYKYWSQLLGMAGGEGRVRLPQVGLTDNENQAISTAVESTGLI